MSFFEFLAFAEDFVPLETTTTNESYYTTFNNKIMKEHFKKERTQYLKSEEYKNLMAAQTVEEKLNMDGTSVELVRILIDLWMKQGTEPNLTDLVQYLKSLGLLCHCPEVMYGPSINQDYLNFVKTWLARYGEIPDCGMNNLAMQYFHYEHKFPSATNLGHYVAAARNFTGESKIGETWKPAKCDKLAVLEREKCENKFNETSCVLCMETFGTQDQCVQLKCGHVFHSRIQDACSGIQTWLEQNGKCPTCNEKIE